MKINYLFYAAFALFVSICDAQTQIITKHSTQEARTNKLGGCPEVTSFTLTGTTSESASFSWGMPAGDIEGYAIDLFEPGADPNVDPIIAGGSLYFGNMGTVEFLDPETSYDAYILTVCNPTGTVSEYVGPISFTTMTLGLQNHKNFEVKVYPVPARTQLHFESCQPLDFVKILDVSGKHVLNKSPNSFVFKLDISYLSKGAYFVQTGYDDQILIQKVVKN